MGRACQLGIMVVFGMWGAIAQQNTPAFAQNITLDGTLGPAGTLIGPDYIIPQDAGQTVGSNLFHSFGQFSLDIGEAAIFQSAPDIRTILSRVTGGSTSLINGAIYTESLNVNLFLINPSGIVFGPDASIDVGGTTRGSFVATTANALVWPNGSQFSATNPSGANSLLTIVGDPGGFLAQVSPQPIGVSGSTLAVYPGQSLVLVGGNVNLDGGRLGTSGGRVELGGLSEPGTIGLNVEGNNLSLSLPTGVQRADLSLTNGALVSVRGAGGGSITLNARNLEMLGGSQVWAGIASRLDSVSSQVGDIALNATGAIRIGESSRIENNVDPNATGNSGNIRIDAGSFSLLDSAELETSTRGRGNAGSIFIQANDSILLESSDIFTIASFGATGNTGSIRISGGSVSLRDDATLSAIAIGQENGGSIFVQANDTVSIADSSISSTVFLGGGGKSGNIDIQAKSVVLSDKSLLLTSTFLGRGDAGDIQVSASESISIRGASQLLTEKLFGGQGNAGHVTLQAGETISLANNSKISSRVDSGIEGNGGNITIQTGSLSLTDGAQLQASTGGEGNAGSVNITATNSVSFDGVSTNKRSSGVFSLVERGAVGNNGDINIQAESLSLTNGAVVNASTSGQGNGGNIAIAVREKIIVDGVGSDGSSSGIYSNVCCDAVGSGGEITLQAGSLLVTNGGRVSTSTFGLGDGGNIAIAVRDKVLLDGVGSHGFSSGIFSNIEPEAAGKGGDIDIQAESLALTNGAVVNTSIYGIGTGGNVAIAVRDDVSLDGVGSNGAYSRILTGVEEGAIGYGGNITIRSRSLSLTNGAYMSASAVSFGRPGTIQINAAEFVQLKGDSQLSTINLVGRLLFNDESQGDLRIETGRLLIQDNSEIIVSSGLGNAGNLEITANSIELSDESKLIGETVLGNGGNITLNVRDLLLLRHNSKISATADYARIARDPNFRDVLSTVGVTAPNADGGNITINAGFIVAVPKENSDIIANAFEGRGGRIAIAAQGIFGIEPRPRLTPKSDITASSDLGIDGTVQTNTLGVDPSRGLGELPSNVVDATRLIDRRCTPNSRTQERSRFIITGRGGLPPSPNDTLQNESVISNWVSLNSDVETSVPPASITPTSSDSSPLVEAQGWYFNEKGEVILTAKAAKVTPQGDWLSLPECNPAQTPSTLQS